MSKVACFESKPRTELLGNDAGHRTVAAKEDAIIRAPATREQVADVRCDADRPLWAVGQVDNGAHLATGAHPRVVFALGIAEFRTRLSS